MPDARGDSVAGGRLFDRLPAWLVVGGGVAAVGLGLILATRPLTSLTVLAVLIGVAAIVTGIGDLRDSDVSAGVAWIVFGVVVLVTLNFSLGWIAPAVAVALVIGGAVRLARARRGRIDERLAAAFLGVAEIVFGAIAFVWPDATLLIVAVLFGIRTVIFGATTIWQAVRRTRTPATPSPKVSPLRRFGSVAVAVVALVVALVAAGVSAKLRAGSPTVDDFYTAPDHVPAEPGQLLRAEPFTQDIPDDARAWRILYTTTRDDAVPAIASGIVLVGRDAPTGPRPVLAWAHGTTGYAENCAPTVLEHPLAAGALPALDAIVDRGWVLVATDYVGLGTSGPHPYLIGQGEARSVLDAVRAARHLEDVELADQTVVWGHSQGGHAALWTGILAPTYAPDAGVLGVAAMAPASDTIGLTANIANVLGGSVFASYVVAAYTDTYADVAFDAYVDPAATTIVRQMSQRCLAEPGVFVSVLTALSIDRDRPIYRVDPTTGPFGDRLRQNIPTGSLAVPVLIAQGGTDPLVVPQLQRAYAAARCADGWNVDYREYAGRDHMGVVAPDSPLIPDLLAWTDARLVGQRQLSTC